MTDELTYRTPRVYQGQMVEVSYAWDGMTLYRRITDHADRSATVSVADLAWEEADPEAVCLADDDDDVAGFRWRPTAD